ncbi:hypothetical protein T4E_8053, partial [Trichinella pseudospiralis]
LLLLLFSFSVALLVVVVIARTSHVHVVCVVAVSRTEPGAAARAAAAATHQLPFRQSYRYGRTELSQNFRHEHSGRLVARVQRERLFQKLKRLRRSVEQRQRQTGRCVRVGALRLQRQRQLVVLQRPFRLVDASVQVAEIVEQRLEADGQVVRRGGAVDAQFSETVAQFAQRLGQVVARVVVALHAEHEHADLVQTVWLVWRQRDRLGRIAFGQIVVADQTVLGADAEQRQRIAGHAVAGAHVARHCLVVLVVGGTTATVADPSQAEPRLQGGGLAEVALRAVVAALDVTVTGHGVPADRLRRHVRAQTVRHHEQIVRLLQLHQYADVQLQHFAVVAIPVEQQLGQSTRLVEQAHCVQAPGLGQQHVDVAFQLRPTGQGPSHQFGAVAGLGNCEIVEVEQIRRQHALRADLRLQLFEHCSLLTFADQTVAKQMFSRLGAENVLLQAFHVSRDRLFASAGSFQRFTFNLQLNTINKQTDRQTNKQTKDPLTDLSTTKF